MNTIIRKQFYQPEKKTMGSDLVEGALVLGVISMVVVALIRAIAG